MFKALIRSKECRTFLAYRTEQQMTATHNLDQFMEPEALKQGFVDDSKIISRP
jgi:hypothetical protein